MAVPDLRSNSSYYMSKFSTSSQANVRRSYEELAGSYVPQAVIGDPCFTNQQRLYYRQPYSMTMVPPGALLNPPLPFSSHHSIQEPILPKFPPQTFDIPDIHDSNSVFNVSMFDMNNGAATIKQHPVASFESSAGAAAAASGPPSVPPSGVCRTLMSFPGDWQPNFISAAAESTNSSPLTHSEENNSYDIPLPQPLAQQQNVFSSSISKPPVKKAKSPKKRKRKDPNEPQKPVSAYSLFFRNAQAVIKSQNPSATFGDISKIVASMWDNLDNEIKRFYKRQMETAKKEYLKQLAVYRANLTTQESEGRSTNNKDEADQSPQQTASAKASSSSSASSVSSSSLLVGQTEEQLVAQGKAAPDAVTQDRLSQLPRPSSVEATAVHKMPSQQQQQQQAHGMSQMPQSPAVYFQDLLQGPPGGPSQIQSNVYGAQTNVPPMRNVFQSYGERPEYFGSSGMPQNLYMDRNYAAPGPWNHSLRNPDYAAVHDSFLNRHSRNATVGLHGLSEVNDSVKWT